MPLPRTPIASIQGYATGAMRVSANGASRRPGDFSSTARVEKGLPKGPNLFLNCSERLVYVQPLN